ncbi:MOSC domain-containing protein [Asanoa iriomotensis]|uniref:Molybdenum cofactor biosysynthesis protein n=1 Tax=Asanoa iriomotensis TaxID=234613 RepID=A0ABQ4BXF5_9ACTN|nr:MOSC N-terminal beta barrel domain-containing protein [Asanoa iriomotensis]GIF54745.1 molybdenum cofactor biosysynthesis protein [Asanoa iriomotensis]
MRLGAIYTYPVKGCHRVTHDGARVEPWGLAGDRRWMIVDSAGVGVTQRDNAALVFLRAEVQPGELRLTAPGRTSITIQEPSPAYDVGVKIFKSRTAPVPARPAGPEADAWLSEFLGSPVSLVFLHDPTAHVAGASSTVGVTTFADAYPLLLANAASLSALNDWLLEAGDEPVPITRFRPNLVVEGAAPWAEDGWVGGRLRVGGVVFDAISLCDRCVVTTIDQETAVKGKQPLRALGRHRNIDQGLMFGLNLVPSAPGAVQVGDEVELL